ncbi:hypothetical protein ACFYP4_29265 [Streptomyces sp. NPDC005551]|uniref:hypothetical protein n=1 Tax=unclassified Streptomyces TaxID=2593676 RepID=UPI0033DD699C
MDSIEEHVRQVGWRITRSSFADVGQPPPVAERCGFGEAFRYAASGFAHGIVAISRAVITADDEAYRHLLNQLHNCRVFLSYLPAEVDPPS